MTTAYRTCPFCEAMCGLEILVRDGEVARIRADRDDVWYQRHAMPLPPEDRGEQPLYAEIRRVYGTEHLPSMYRALGAVGLLATPRLALDVEYVRTRSLLGDLRILWRTVLVVLRRDGIDQTGGVTMHALPTDRPHA